jgi:phage baseplate assembly protein W
LWTTLADFNNMQNAWTLKNGEPIRPGAILLLPYAAAQGLNVPQAQVTGDLYGTDWAIDPATGDRIANNRPYVSYDGTTYTTTKPQAGDFRTISGLPNLLQAVSHRVRTVVGEVPVAPAYGALPFPVGTALTSAQLVQAMVSVRANMLRDSRILQVAKLTPVRTADTIDISMKVVPVTGGAVGVVAPLGN